MLNTTIEICRSGLKSDPTLTAQDRARLLAALRQSAMQKPAPETSNEPRLIRRAEVAQRLSRSLRFVDKLAASGVLAKRNLPGRLRASGFLASDVDRLIAECGKPSVTTADTYSKTRHN
jgi:predicted DNA-binding transcriptional regulator AlpA